MRKLKKKIKIIESLPPSIKNKKNWSNILLIIPIILIITLSIYLLLPYINAVNIDKILGKKIATTNCNTKDYIIINKDKTYSMELTDNKCNTNYYEGKLKIKNNQIIFNKNIKGIIDNNYNIKINNLKFEREIKNEK